MAIKLNARALDERVSDTPVRPSGHLDRIVRIIEIAEDAVHLVVAILLTALGVVLIIHTVHRFAVALAGPYDMPTMMLLVLNQTLLLFIVAELLHTVVVAIQHGGALDPEPFIVAGLVAGIRRVLILTSGGEQAFHWNPQGIELLILIALILVMSITALVWRRTLRPGVPAKSGEAEQGERGGEVVAGPSQAFGGVGVGGAADHGNGKAAR